MPMRRRTHRWAAWLLPFLVARLFIPAGFMLSPSGEGLGIALCPGYAPLPTPVAAPAARQHHAAMDHGAHATHGESHGPGGTQGSGNQGSAQPICPLAAAGSTASCPATRLVGELPRLADAVPGYQPRPAWSSPAVLIDRIRGPPLV